MVTHFCRHYVFRFSSAIERDNWQYALDKEDEEDSDEDVTPTSFMPEYVQFGIFSLLL